MKALVILVFILHCAQSEKFRVCVVDGRGGFKRATKYCPILDKPESKVECVVGLDRLDCLRKISKGTVDFSVFSPEDLVTAINSEVEVLLTNEMRFTKDKYEYKVVAVISDESGIRSKHDLRGKKYCHPGYGYETDWTNILANYLEASVVPQTCNPSLTLTENRISSSSKFFAEACKAGPWVNDETLDAELKRKYPNLCSLCNSPGKCSTNDKYWGRRGPLYCLTDGLGDISWSRLDDVQAHFGTSRIPSEGFSYLCQDGSVLPINGTKSPCVWVVKPWPVIAAKRKRAQEIRDFFNSIDQNDPNSWQYALLNLIETFKQEIVPLQPVEPIESYLDNAPGFLSANSFTGCHPPRTIRICTTSNVANAKCGWMREAATVYAVEPDLDCVKAKNFTHCMDAIKYGAADLVFVPPDYVNIAKRDYNLKTILYETVPDTDKYLTVAVVKANSKYKTLSDLRDAKACFPKYDGIAWTSVISTLQSKGLISHCPFSEGLAQYFGSSCVPGSPDHIPKSLNTLCEEDMYTGEYGAIRCLDHVGDVAFLSENILDAFFRDPKEIMENLRRENFRILCEKETDPCHLSWSPAGQAMISKNKSNMWIKDTVDVFMQIDNLFGKNYKSVTTPFTLFGLFDGKTNVLLHDATLRLKTVPIAKPNDKMPRQYEEILNNTKICLSSSNVIAYNFYLSISLYLLLVAFK